MKGRYKQMALELRKEKNIIYLIDEEKNRHYYVDINDGLFYNEKTHHSLKRLPFRQYEYAEIVRNLDKTKDYYNAYFAQLFYVNNIQELQSALKIADKYLSFLKTLNIKLENYDCMSNNTKDMEEVLKQAKKAKEVLINAPNLCYYPNRILQQIQKNENPRWQELRNDNNFSRDEKDYLWKLISDYDPIKRELYYYYGYKQKYIKCVSGWEFRDIIDTYINNCRKLGKEPIKTPNGMREFAETALTVERTKEERDQKKWTEIYTRLAPKVSFEYGNYVVVLPEKPNDLIIEGELMHHCVGSYVDKVVDEQTYIVFVRRKDNPNTPYITAEIKLNGKLGQYYLSSDRDIKLPADIEFKNAYQNHLNEVWDE